MAIAETGRIPVDNPSTHLELTMIHEAMVLEYSGPSLALIEWAGAIKLTLMMALLAGLFAPWGMATSASIDAVVLAPIAFVLKLAAMAAGHCGDRKQHCQTAHVSGSGFSGNGFGVGHSCCSVYRVDEVRHGFD